ncbi:hypothetical protein [Staphylococcus haemolyticus]|uniref:hypothetical protein n=1 Tax=Staphylococcus haemolyticus TaxID=1283 RepID=UPI0015D70544|nr:hypothetical protein [Staphylococcus haemolyticus]
MTNDDKTFVLTGFMFIAVFFLLLIALNVTITIAAAIALLVSRLTYIFLDTCYYVKKDKHVWQNGLVKAKGFKFIYTLILRFLGYMHNGRIRRITKRNKTT